MCALELLCTHLRTHTHVFQAQPREEITITLPDGTERKGRSWETCPMDVAKEVSKSLSERVVIAKVRHTRRV
jgi:threonyl-tRNA synthetase